MAKKKAATKKVTKAEKDISTVISVKVTKAFREKLQKKATARGMPLSTYGRWCIERVIAKGA